jgi:carboxymethylenebutenolidase
MPDGGEMNLTVWRPDSGNGPALLLIHEIFGVGSYVRGVGARLAEAGYVVGAPDVFWRFAPGYQAVEDEAGLAASLANAANLDVPQAIADCSHALGALARVPGVTGAPGVIGFCLGGTLAFAVAAAAEPSVCVSYYGSGIPAMLDQLDAISCPILFHFGSLDTYIAGDTVEAIASAAAGRADTIVNVEIAGHAFDNPAPLVHDENAAKAAWSKTMAFLSEHLPA